MSHIDDALEAAQELTGCTPPIAPDTCGGEWMFQTLRRAAPLILREARRRGLPREDDGDLLRDVVVGFWAEAKGGDLAERRMVHLAQRWIRAGMGGLVLFAGRPNSSQRFPTNAIAPSASLVIEESRLRLRRALDQLPAVERHIVEARYLDGVPTKQAAVDLGLSAKAVERRGSRALARLRELLGRSDRRA
ncbi:MAG TPA: sigma-70 family RNA polymerase sigma factor [Planctomycetota bacterium]|nr:sigma-70 family RNA polymerase sigma factor [Planctomycetota bacterium]